MIALTLNRRFYAAPALALSLCLLAPMARADDAKPPVQTLAQALALAEAPKSDLYIAVGAEKIALPEGTSAAQAGDTASRVAAIYGRKVSAFGEIEAVAPPTVMVIDVPPDTPDIYDGMEPKQIVKMLAATFTKEQWKAFLHEEGVGYADLRGDDQRRLFEALFPEGKLEVLRMDAVSPDAPKTTIGADQLRQSRLRLAYKTSIALPEAGNPGSQVFANGYQPPDKPVLYVMMNSPSDSVEREFGATVRETLPNTLKPSDLRDDDTAWQTQISLSNVKTVDDAARAIAAATGREVYADPRYGKQSVVTLGPGGPRRAYDLMRALALCVGGAWRKAGPAIVLTNDRVGLAVKHEMWREFEAKAAALAPTGKSYEPVKQPDGANYTIADIPFTADTVSLTDAQRAKYLQSMTERTAMMGSDLLQLTIPFSELSPEQQTAARHIQEANTRDHLKTTLDGDVTLQCEPMTQFVVPSLDAPVLMFQSYERILPSVLSADGSSPFVDHLPMGPGPAAQPSPADPASALPALLRTFEHRAALIEAATPEEIDRNIDAMKTLGLNELWLRVSLGADAHGDDAALDLLRHAARSAKAAHMSLLPSVRLLTWGDASSDELLDRTVMGRTSEQEYAATQQDMNDVHNTVTPFAPETAQRLGAFLGAAARIPGVAGMLWTDITPHGYEDVAMLQDNSQALGYALPGRLAALRQTHADALDIHSVIRIDTRANISLPGFGDDAPTETALFDVWSALRAHTEQTFLSALFSHLPPSFAPGARQFPILTPPSGEAMFISQYGSWDDWTKPQPSATFVPLPGPDGKPVKDGPGTENLITARTYQIVTLYTSKSETPAKTAAYAIRSVRRFAQSKATCVVLQGAANSPDALARLAATVRADPSGAKALDQRP